MADVIPPDDVLLPIEILSVTDDVLLPIEILSVADDVVPIEILSVTDDVLPIEVLDVEDDNFFTPISCRGTNRKDDVLPIEVLDVEDFNFFTPISCRGTNRKDAISVEQYAQDKVLHRAIRASILLTKQIIDLSEEEEDDEVEEITPTSPFGKKPFRDSSVTETGQSSNSNSNSNSAPTFLCEICVEPKSQNESFSIKGCIHSYCSECMIRYVAAKIQENITLIQCPEPNCKGVLEPEYCRLILPQKVFDRWGDALCESLIVGSERFYCPFKDCSMLLIDDGGETVTESECPNCRRLFCAQCKVPWHSGIDCATFQNLNEDERGREDIMMMELAKHRNWQRCPKCRFYVEKSEGCMYMKCRNGGSWLFEVTLGVPLHERASKCEQQHGSSISCSTLPSDLISTPSLMCPFPCNHHQTLRTTFNGKVRYRQIIPQIETRLN
ncbi:hypothetical protein HHK36_014459 [Tetracentron sinense]|uniref:RBR-type E3 ubiquitin transferase n=1 Tax=Tetracentron sinense TaxID=13715 RepID=A0A834Z8B9_TETSI|nr:hypothetical protein HHK36_014459 [Tetracentron sinense]